MKEKQELKERKQTPWFDYAKNGSAWPILLAICDKSIEIRTTMGTTMYTYVTNYGTQGWTCMNEKINGCYVIQVGMSYFRFNDIRSCQCNVLTCTVWGRNVFSNLGTSG